MSVPGEGGKNPCQGNGLTGGEIFCSRIRVWASPLGRRGPAAKPIAIREAEGTRKNLYVSRGAHVDPSLPDPPAHLRDDELVVWHHFAPILAGMRLLTEADIETLADYCECVAAAHRFKTASYGVEIQVSATGWAAPSGAYTSWQKQRDRALKLAGRLGFTPADRASMPRTDEDDEDPFEKFLAAPKER